jgi:spore coat protein H
MVLGFFAACDAGSGDDFAVSDSADYVFDDSVIRTYELIIDEADWAWLNENELLEQYVPATLIFEGKEYPQVAVRYKGFFGALRLCFDRQGNRICKKLPMKLKFSEYDESGRFYGLKRLNFHSMEFDPTKMHEVLAYGLFREAGVPAPRATYAKLVVNGEPLGLFALVEEIDGMFTRSRFPDGGKGNLYKEVWPVHFDPAPYLQALRTNRDEDPSVDKMIRFARALDEATDETFLSVLESWTDVDVLMRYLAVDRLIDNWDGIIAWYCVSSICVNHNYYWYEDVVRDRVWLIPWDLDHTFEVPSPIRTFYRMPDWDVVLESCDPIPVFHNFAGRPPGCDDLIRRLATVAWDPYCEATRELLDGPFQTAALHDRIDKLADHIADAVAEDANGPEVAEWQAAVQRLKDNVVTMRSYIEAKVGQ